MKSCIVHPNSCAESSRPANLLETIITESVLTSTLTAAHPLSRTDTQLFLHPKAGCSITMNMETKPSTAERTFPRTTVLQWSQNAREIKGGNFCLEPPSQKFPPDSASSMAVSLRGGKSIVAVECVMKPHPSSCACWKQRGNPGETSFKSPPASASLFHLSPPLQPILLLIGHLHTPLMKLAPFSYSPLFLLPPARDLCRVRH